MQLSSVLVVNAVSANSTFSAAASPADRKIADDCHTSALEQRFLQKESYLSCVVRLTRRARLIDGSLYSSLLKRFSGLYIGTNTYNSDMFGT